MIIDMEYELFDKHAYAFKDVIFSMKDRNSTRIVIVTIAPVRITFSNRGEMRRFLETTKIVDGVARKASNRKLTVIIKPIRKRRVHVYVESKLIDILGSNINLTNLINELLVEYVLRNKMVDYIGSAISEDISKFDIYG